MVWWTSVRRLARSAARLTPGERRAALRAGWWLCAAVVGVRVAGYEALRGLIERLPVRTTHATLGADAYGKAIERAARVVPGTTCLAQALAAACMLRRDGVASTLTIGVAVGERRSLEAHAWLDAADLRVTGARDEGELHVIVRDSIGARP